MVELFEKDTMKNVRQSSKGNQLKWRFRKNWYKADYTGYEGLAEYAVSCLLKESSLQPEEFIVYQTEEILYRKQRFRGCASRDFLPEGWQLITLERLFYNFYGEGLYRNIFRIEGVTERAEFLVDQVVRMTGLKKFGEYLTKLLTIDALFLNEDRHTHNIAVLLDQEGTYHYCPVFDNGAALLSDTSMDYPTGTDIIDLIPQVRAKTLSSDFGEQLEAVENLYGRPLKFSFDGRLISEMLEREQVYPDEIKKRVRDILLQQKRSYGYLFR